VLPHPGGEVVRRIRAPAARSHEAETDVGMRRHLQRQIDTLKQRLTKLFELVERNVSDAIEAICTRDTDMAMTVIFNDTEIDRHEIELEDECLHTLALHQPVASDMRFVASVLTITKDLERIGDLTVNLGEQVLHLASSPMSMQPPFDLESECRTVLKMLHNCLDALVKEDTQRARQVLVDDCEVDTIHREMYSLVKQSIKLHPDAVDSLIDWLNASRHLERIGDHAVNIAEDVIHMVEGEVVRHNHLRDVARNG
jgi:phosphate transport system protein